MKKNANEAKNVNKDSPLLWVPVKGCQASVHLYAQGNMGRLQINTKNHGTHGKGQPSLRAAKMAQSKTRLLTK